MNLRHNYKLILGPRKDGNPSGLLSAHYDSLVLLLIDAKNYLKTYECVALHIRNFNVEVCTLDCDGGVVWHITEEEFAERARSSSKQWEERAKHYRNVGDINAAEEREYLARVYPEALMMEYRFIKSEVTK